MKMRSVRYLATTETLQRTYINHKYHIDPHLYYQNQQNAMCLKEMFR